MKPELIVVGASWGGIDALKVILAGLPADFTVPIAIVQHRGRDTQDGLVEVLAAQCPLPVLEINDKDALIPGRIYVAPSDYHALVDGQGFALSIDEPVSWARPSIDLLFESAAEAHRAGVIGVLLTGRGRDGVEGLRAIRAQGGTTIVQAPETAESDAMPRAAIEADAAELILPLDRIAQALVERVRLERPRLAAG